MESLTCATAIDVISGTDLGTCAGVGLGVFIWIEVDLKPQ